MRHHYPYLLLRWGTRWYVVLVYTFPNGRGIRVLFFLTVVSSRWNSVKVLLHWVQHFLAVTQLRRIRWKQRNLHCFHFYKREKEKKYSTKLMISFFFKFIQLFTKIWYFKKQKYNIWRHCFYSKIRMMQMLRDFPILNKPNSLTWISQSAHFFCPDNKVA